MQPSVLILDEPTSQLDPIASGDFLQMLHRINRELGTTVIITEHRLEEIIPMSDKVIVLDEGKVIADGTPNSIAGVLGSSSHSMYAALPVPMRVYGAVKNDLSCPLTVREGRAWLEEYAKTSQVHPELIPTGDKKEFVGEPVITLEDVWFRYEKELPDILKGLDLSVYKGELLAIVGGNGTGKTTALSVMSGLLHPYRGKVRIFGKELSQAMIGFQMAFAYVGFCVLPPLFGFIADYITISLLPQYLLALLAITALMHEITVSKTRNIQL